MFLWGCEEGLRKTLGKGCFYKGRGSYPNHSLPSPFSPYLENQNKWPKQMPSLPGQTLCAPWMVGPISPHPGLGQGESFCPPTLTLGTHAFQWGHRGKMPFQVAV